MKISKSGVIIFLISILIVVLFLSTFIEAVHQEGMTGRELILVKSLLLEKDPSKVISSIKDVKIQDSYFKNIIDSNATDAVKVSQLKIIINKLSESKIEGNDIPSSWSQSLIYNTPAPLVTTTAKPTTAKPTTAAPTTAKPTTAAPTTLNVVNDQMTCTSSKNGGLCLDTMKGGSSTLNMQGDGNLVLYRDGLAKWASSTNGKGKGPYQFYMQPDGNLVVYDSTKKALWASNTYRKGTGPYRAVIQGDNNFVVYDSKNTALWDSKTRT
jgi:hypothetical protein